MKVVDVLIDVLNRCMMLSGFVDYIFEDIKQPVNEILESLILSLELIDFERKQNDGEQLQKMKSK